MEQPQEIQLNFSESDLTKGGSSLLSMLLFLLSHSVVSNSLRTHGLQPAGHLCPWGFSRQERWMGLPCPPPGDVPNPGFKSGSPALQVDSLPAELPGKPYPFLPIMST